LQINQVHENKIRIATFSKIKPALSSKYYYILTNTTLPECQVKEQTSTKQEGINKLAKETIKQGTLNGTLPSIVADSAATSNVGTTKDKSAFNPTGRPSNKIFQLPNGTRTAADTISELPFNIHQPTKDIHILPSITNNSLFSIPKTLDAGYITVFDDKEINIYDARDTKVLVTRKAILCGWYNKQAKLWCLPLVPIVLNKNMVRFSQRSHPPSSCQSYHL
jgi:hypothetical protein